LKLLLDQNISHRILPDVNSDFPGSSHVKELNIETSGDSEIWEYAKSHNFTIVSKDSDFHQRSFLYGPPPKVIWIQIGNCSTEDILSTIKKHATAIESFIKSSDQAFLILE
jgi:predicted nuclease of predicted toxin-antitoxin system